MSAGFTSPMGFCSEDGSSITGSVCPVARRPWRPRVCRLPSTAQASRALTSSDPFLTTPGYPSASCASCRACPPVSPDRSQTGCSPMTHAFKNSTRCPALDRECARQIERLRPVQTSATQPPRTLARGSHDHFFLGFVLASVLQPIAAHAIPVPACNAGIEITARVKAQRACLLPCRVMAVTVPLPPDSR